MSIPIEKEPLLWSQRLLLAFMIFLGTCFVYSARVNLSVAILCMVRSDLPPETTTLPFGENGFGTNESSTSPSLSTNQHNLTHNFEENPQRKSDFSNDGEFDWDKSIRSRLLSMYFYGYIITQIPGGWLASKYGGRRVLGVGMLVSSLCSLLTPAGARLHVNLAFAIRFILGFSAGVTFPCCHQIWGKWAPTFERSKLAALGYAGPLIGLIATFSLSGLLCEHGFDNGWGSIFYLTGLFNLLWVFLWFFLTADTPDEHKRISNKEKAYIRKAIGDGLVEKRLPTPWLKIITSRPIWALVIAHFCHNYTNYTLLTSLPTFMKESLDFDIKENGFLSALPYLSQAFSTVTAGYLADTINERGWMSVKNQRKVYQAVSLIGAGLCLCVTAQIDRSHRYAAVALLCLCTAFMGLRIGAYMVNHIDLAPSYAGVLMGITNTVATIPGMIAPIIAGAFTPNRTAEEWANVLYLCAAVAAIGAMLYGSMAEGELQTWARATGTEDHVDTKEGHQRLMSVTSNSMDTPQTVDGSSHAHEKTSF